MNGKSNQANPGSELGMVKASTETLVKITRELPAETVTGSRQGPVQTVIILRAIHPESSSGLC
jgi:hypothetical protein